MGFTVNHVNEVEICIGYLTILRLPMYAKIALHIETILNNDQFGFTEQKYVQMTCVVFPGGTIFAWQTSSYSIIEKTYAMYAPYL